MIKKTYETNACSSGIIEVDSCVEHMDAYTEIAGLGKVLLIFLRVEKYSDNDLRQAVRSSGGLSYMFEDPVVELLTNKTFPHVRRRLHTRST
jgi:hypothetical protein